MMEPPRKEEPMFPARTPKQKKQPLQSGADGDLLGVAGAVGGRAGPTLPPHMRKEASSSNSHKSNSTSSLYVDSTITSPDINQVLHCMATALYYHIRAGHEAPQRKFIDIFSEETHPIFLKDQREPNDLRSIPRHRPIYKFINTIFKVQKLPSECAILALAYTERLIGLTGITLHASNWRRITLSTIILASKVWEDLAVWNVDFISIFKNLSIKDLGVLEKQLLRLLEYNVSVPSSLYAKYYFELRELAEKDAKTFPLTPLDKERAEKLEERARTIDENLAQKKKRLSTPVRNSTGGIGHHKSPIVVLNLNKEKKEKD
jgi:hypothetical protein